MELTASDLYSLHRPSKCTLRIFLKHLYVEENAPSPYVEVLRILGERHEKNHLSEFKEYVDLSGEEWSARLQRTIDLVHQQVPVIYQPMMRATLTINNEDCIVLGVPDFLILEQDNYLVRDSKITKRITERDHPEILLQLQLYGWLFEETFGKQPLALQVHNGPGDIIEIPNDSGNSVMQILSEIVELKQCSTEPFSPVGWTKCIGCGYKDRCWMRAESDKSVAMVPGIDQGLAVALHNEGICTLTDLTTQFNEEQLTEYKRPWGTRLQRVGKTAKSVLLGAKSLASGREFLLAKPNIPEYSNYVMFDLEGLPPQMDELDKIYLWGMQVFGNHQGEFLAATAGFESEGDKAGWFKFLELSRSIFNEHGDIPFVHWHHYEKTNVKKYIDRYGDLNGIAQRVLNNLLDLLPITKNSIILPLPSYSLKVVEQYVGFTRTLDEYGGDWAMAKYIEATETKDENLRNEIFDKILLYNKEDLEATWAVLTWLKQKM